MYTLCMQLLDNVHSVYAGIGQCTFYCLKLSFSGTQTYPMGALWEQDAGDVPCIGLYS